MQNRPGIRPQSPDGFPGKIQNHDGYWTITDDGSWPYNGAHERWTSHFWVMTHWNGYLRIAQRLLEVPTGGPVRPPPGPLAETICGHLRQIGVRAQVSGGTSQDVVDIAGGPISRIRVSPTDDSVACIVLDMRTKPSTPWVSVMSRRSRIIPFVGRVREVRWKHHPTSEYEAQYEEELDPEELIATKSVATDLEEDAGVASAIVKAGLDIVVQLDEPEWQISTGSTSAWTKPARLRATWACHQTIAAHLLETPIPDPLPDDGAAAH